MSDMLDRVALSVSIVIHRIDAPLVTGTMMRRMLDSIKKRIPEHHVRTRHVDLGPEDLLAVSILAVPHLTEKLQVLLHAPVSVRTLGTRLVDSTATFTDLFLSLVIHISEPPLDKLLSPLIQLVEILRSIFLLIPLKTKPFDILLNR